MKKLCFIVLALIMSLTLCCGLTACSGGDKIVEQLQSEIGAILEGGKFKEGSVLNVNEVKVTSEQADDIFEKLEDIGITVSDKTKAYIYDIFVTKDGKEVQPNGKVKVTVPMPQEDTGYLVYHIEDGNKAVKIPSTYADGKISFETDGFSCYVFVATGYVNDSSNLKIQYQLTVDVQPANGGYIEINGEKQNASEGIWLPAGYNRLQAFENEGYVFDCWWDADFDEMLMEDDVCDFYMNNKRHLIAKFKEAPYTLELNVNGYGVIEFNGTTVSSQTWESVERNASVTLTATAYGSYEFAGWYTPSGLLSESETYTFTMDGNKSIEAKFNDTGRVGMLFSATPEGSGYFVYNNVKSDEIAEKWEIGTEYTVRAVPNPGYIFLYWEIENEKIRSEVYSGTVPSDGLYCLAVFDAADYYLEVSAVGGKIQEQYIDDTRVNDAEFVTEYKKGFYNVNSVTLTAEADEGYRFVGWYNEEGLLSDYASVSVSFSDEKQIKLEARFEKIEYRFSASASEGGYITENGEAVDFGNGRIVDPDTQITLTAVASDGYEFVGWYKGGQRLSEEVSYVFTVSDDMDVEAIFELIPPTTYRFLCEIQGNGKIWENNEDVTSVYMYGVTLAEGTNVTLTATADTYWRFVGWYNAFADGELISADATYTFKLTEHISVYALFEEKITYNFLAQCSPSEGGYITENGETVDFGNGRPVEMNEQITLTAVANTGYEFKGWGTRDDEWNLTIISTEATYTFTVTGKTYVQAVFAEKPNGLKIDAHNAGFTYNENDELTTTVYTIGSEIQPNIEHVGVYATFNTSQDEYLILDEDYTRDLGGLDFTEAGTYTVTYTYKKDTSLTATLTVQVVEKSADGSLTEAEWNAAIAYWKAQTNIKVLEQFVSLNSGNVSQTMIYQLNGTAYFEDVVFDDEEISYKGKATYIVKIGDKYYQIGWSDGKAEDDGFWNKTDYGADTMYDEYLDRNIYNCIDFYAYTIDFSYENFTYDATDKVYKTKDGTVTTDFEGNVTKNENETVTVAFTFEGEKLTKIVVTVVQTGNNQKSVRTITFGDATVNIPSDVKCAFSIGVKTEDTWSEDAGYITENGEKAEYWYDYLDDGTSLTLTAVANDGYVFKRWAKQVFADGEYVWVTYSTDATYTTTADGEYGALYAVFEKVEAES